MENGLHIDKVGTQRWYLNDLLHREDGPAIIHAEMGRRTREDGPAVEYSDGYKEWYLAGYPFFISKNDSDINIGCKFKPTVNDWDEWFAGDEEFVHKRDSTEFQVLLKLWDQFKRQCEVLEC